jgi:hypothetical protein
VEAVVERRERHLRVARRALVERGVEGLRLAVGSSGLCFAVFIQMGGPVLQVFGRRKVR